MADILEIIEEPIVENTKEVEHDGTRYLFKGTTDAGLVLEAYMTDDATASKWARHCTAINGREIKPNMIRFVQMVQKTMQTDIWVVDTPGVVGDPDAKPPIKEVPEVGHWVTRMIPNTEEPMVEFDITVIAAFSQRIGADFVVKFLAAAKEVLGLDKTNAKPGKEETGNDVFNKLAAGNSDAPETV